MEKKANKINKTSDKTDEITEENEILEDEKIFKYNPAPDKIIYLILVLAGGVLGWFALDKPGFTGFVTNTAIQSNTAYIGFIVAVIFVIIAIVAVKKLWKPHK